MLKIFKKFFQFCDQTNRRKFYISLVFVIIVAIAEAMKIPAIYIILNAAINNTLTNATIIQCIIIMVLSIIIGSFTKYFSAILQTEAGYTTAANKRIDIAEHLKYLPMGYFNKNSLGYITSITTNTMENLADVATRVVLLTTQGLLTTIIIDIYIFVFDFRIGIILTIGMILFLFSNSLMQNKSEKISPLKIQSDTKLVEKVIEYVMGIAEIKAFNTSNKIIKDLYKAIDNNQNTNIQLEITFIPYMAMQTIIIKLTGIFMTIFSIYFYIDGTMDLLICICMMICSFMVLLNLEQAGQYSSLLRIVDLSVDKANEIFRIQPMDIDGKNIIPDNYNIEAHNVEFAYDFKKIINDISLKIPEHTTTAIVGPSGSGKTTLCHLIARFWDVDTGYVQLNNHDVREYSMDSLMKNYSFVFQNVYLFSDTIANNIRFGNEKASMNEVIKASKKACCHDFIMNLPDGYDTIIGGGGANLSGGEKQRISIARAIMKDAPIIILDEATANVDPENEKELMEAIEALTKEKTIIMIAHRLKTVRHANQIIVVDKGKIVQCGNHEELIKQDGIYKRFIHSRELAASWKL